jgi:Zn finger protein HypA/HybF involved in hydrogenase expression
MNYTKNEILKAAEIGEVSMIDAEHIVSLLDKARMILNTKNHTVKCMSCEKEVEYSTGIFTCYECSN